MADSLLRDENAGDDTEQVHAVGGQISVTSEGDHGEDRQETAVRQMTLPRIEHVGAGGEGELKVQPAQPIDDGELVLGIHHFLLLRDPFALLVECTRGGHC